MARILNSLLARIIGSALLVNVVLAPPLYLQLTRIARESEAELFINDVRAYVRFLSELLEFELDRVPSSELSDLLDSVVLSRDTVYARIVGPELNVASTLIGETSDPYQEDFVFGGHGDDVYFLSVPLETERYGVTTLLLGFDERPTAGSLERAGRQVIAALAVFLGLSMLMALAMGLLITRPLRGLQRVSQRVAHGSLDEPFDVTSGVLEVRELAQDLHDMRANLVRMNERLRQEVAERDALERSRAELEQTLRHVQKLETIGTLAGGIAHELNNVLQPMKFYAELAYDDSPPASSVRADLGRVLSLVARAKGVVQQILTFSRRAQPDDFALIDVGHIVREAVMLARGLFPPTIEVGLAIEGDTDRIMGDVTQIHQLVMNLCSNAYKALSDRGGKIEVTVCRIAIESVEGTAAPDLAPGAYVRIDVRDDGIGIDPVVLERVFEPFFTSRPPGEGTGLGLSVALGIARAHGGTITASSKLGAGSVFSAFFPVAKSNVARARRNGTLSIAGTYAGAAKALSENRALIERAGLTEVRIGSLAEIVPLLDRREPSSEIVVVDLSEENLWRELIESSEIAELCRRSDTLVVLPIEALLSEPRFDWAIVHYAVRPLGFRDLQAAAERLIKKSAIVNVGGAL